MAGENFKDFVSRSDGFSGKCWILKNFVRRTLKKKFNCNKINPYKYYIIIKKLSLSTDFSITQFELNLSHKRIGNEGAGTLGLEGVGGGVGGRVGGGV